MQNLYPLRALCFRAVLSLILILSIQSIDAQELMRANLFVVPANNTAPVLMDGSLTMYDNNYSNDVDWDDAEKMSNPGENFGIVRQNKTLVIERRQVVKNTDTSVLKMWNLQQSRTYQVQVITQNLNHPELFAFVMDSYLNRSTPINLNGTTAFNFNINADPASKVQTRFKIIYHSIFAPAPVSFSFSGIRLNRSAAAINVEWNVENDFSIEKYIVEHSADGRNFSPVSTLMNTGNTTGKYNYTDAGMSAGDNYYRIQAIGMNGVAKFSSIAKLDAPVKETAISIYPNPVENKQARLSINAAIAGNYQVSLIYTNGLQQPLSKFNITEGKNQQVISLPASLSPGIYRLKITAPDRSVQTKTITVL